MLRRPVILAMVLGTSLPVFAQKGPDNDPDGLQGYVDNVFHHSSIDSVNLYNGQLTVPIGIGPTYPIGPSLKLQLAMTYGSRVSEYGRPASQNPDGPVVVLAGDPANGMSWTFTLGAIKTCAGGQMCFMGPDGSQHVFDASDSNRGAGYFKTSDAEQLSLRNVGTDVSGEGPFEMWDSDGNHYVFNWHVSGFDDSLLNFTHDFGRGRDGWYLSSVTDPFGNHYSVGYRTGVGPCWSYASGTSCPGQVMQCPGASTNLWIPQTVFLPTGNITISTNANQMISGFAFPVSGGGTATWSLIYQTASAAESCGGDIPDIHPNVFELQSIQLPNSIGSYQFSYAGTGLLSHVQIPTGATVDYSYVQYSFYHGRLAELNQNCNPIAPDPSAIVLMSRGAGSSIEATSRRSEVATRPEDGGVCTQQPNYLDQPLGVAQRIETVSGVPSTTTYTQISFPFGEQGVPKINCSASSPCGGQTLTIVVQPPDVDGRTRAKGILFWSAPKSPTQAAYAGDRTGADIEERVYDSDPTVGVNLTMPTCGGSIVNPFCADHAVRVTQRTYEYDNSTSEIGNRRLLSETVYHQPPAANDVCTGCKYHTVTYSNAGSHTWEGNGRHYNVEAHTGNLGNDLRTITTDWTSQLTAVWLPNLYDSRIESDSTLSVNRYFEYDLAKGFLNCSFLHDPAAGRVFFNRRYAASDGTLAQDLTATGTGFANPPAIGQCAARYPTPPVPSGTAVGVDGDKFGKIYSYQNGLLTSTRWINGNTPATWYAKLFVRDLATGWITSSYDTAGLATALTYDSVGRATSLAPPGETATSVSYPTTTRTIATRTSSSLLTYNEYDYDGLGRLAREIQLMPAGAYAVRQHGFDPAGHAYFDSEWGGCASPAGDCQTSSPEGTRRSNFDPFDRPQTTTVADGATTTTSFADSYSLYSDTQESVTFPCINGTWSGGSCSGGSASTTAYVSDAFGRLTSVTESGGAIANYVYDVNGKLHSVAQGAQTRTFAYDPAGDLRSQTTPEEGVVSYDYGALANVKQETHGSVVLTRAYDFAGRPTTVSSNEGGGRTYVTNIYDQAAGSSLGKLTSRVGSNYSVSPATTISDSFTYSGLGGRLSTRQTSVAGVSSLTTSQTWQYNSLGLVAHYAHPRPAGALPFVLSSDYDAGHPTKEYVNGIPVVSSIAYAPSGAVRSYTTGVGIGHNVTTDVVPDPTLLPRPVQIFSIEQASLAILFDTKDYSYDGAGNVKSIGLDIFGYDPLSRLVSASLQVGAGSSSQTYTYDRYGNMTFRSIGGNPVNYPIDPATNHLTNVSYDGRGSVIQNGGEAFAYDGLERMVQATTTSVWKYLYDGANERTVKIPPSGSATYQLRDEGNRISTEITGTTPSRDNAYLGNLLVASYSNCAVSGNCSYGGVTKGPWQFVASDHLGTPRLMSGLSGEQLDARKYWPYGDEAVGAADDPQRLRLAAMERDTEGSRYYDHARSHDFGLARFLSPDPAGSTLTQPQSWNRYAYVGLNPLNGVDPTGLSPEPDESVAERTPCMSTRECQHQAAEAAKRVISLKVEASVSDTNGKKLGASYDYTTGEAETWLGQTAHGAHGATADLGNTAGAAGTTPDFTISTHVSPLVTVGASSNAEVFVALGPAVKLGKATFELTITGLAKAKELANALSAFGQSLLHQQLDDVQRKTGVDLRNPEAGLTSFDYGVQP